MTGFELWRRELMDRFDQRSLRERLLLMAAAVSVIAVVWDGLLMAPLVKQRRSAEQQLEHLRVEVSGLESGLQTMKQQAATEADRAVLDEVARLQTEVAALGQRLDSTTSGLIAPAEMRRVLERVLRQATPLKLRMLRSLPPEPLIVAAPAPDASAQQPGSPTAVAANASGPASDAPQIYKHGLEIEWTGTYLDTLRLLQELETLPWRFFWDRIEFKVERHPQGVVRIRLYTLGLHEGWIGV